VGGELELRLLGPLEAVVDGASVSLPGRKPRALLVVLGLDPGRAVSVDRLVDELWAADPPETAAHAVKVYVSQLRQALPGAIETRHDGYALALAPERVDARRFARLAEDGRRRLRAGDAAGAAGLLADALALWRGEALAEFLYEPFAQVEIARLDELRLGAVEDRLDAQLALGLGAQLVGELQALLAAQPLRERLHGQLMLALYRAGRQGDALAAYRAARRELVDGIGVEPGPALRRLERAILRQDEALLPTATVAVRATRRLVTMLSAECELPGGDPEREQAAIEHALDAVAAVVVRHGGIGARGGDGSFTAAFGAARANEDDALRAARAALELCGPAVRIGLESGELLTGAGRRAGTRCGSPSACATRRAPARSCSARGRPRSCSTPRASSGATDGSCWSASTSRSPPARAAPTRRSSAGSASWRGCARPSARRSRRAARAW
jgi:DNA-binding SARP family transcriptional activator